MLVPVSYPFSRVTPAPAGWSRHRASSEIFFPEPKSLNQADCELPALAAKEAIQPMDKASEAILALEPVTFRYKHELDPRASRNLAWWLSRWKGSTPIWWPAMRWEAFSVRYEAVNAMLLNEFLIEHRKVEKLEEDGCSAASGFRGVHRSIEGASPKGERTA